MQKKVAVIFGGMSSENEISIITGTMACNLIDSQKYAIYPVYLSVSGEFFYDSSLKDIKVFSQQNFIKKASKAIIHGGKLCKIKSNKIKPVCKIDVILNCCHGKGGEDGLISSIAQLNGIANASPDALASAVFMDKAVTKLISKSLAIKSVDYFKISKRDYEKRGKMALKCVESRLKYPVIVKPSKQGSSIGVVVAHDKLQLINALDTAFNFDDIVIVEKFLKEKREINCAAYRKNGDVVVSECEEPILKQEFLTFSDKYENGDKERRSIFPAKISERQSVLIKSYTKLLYKRLDLRGVVRADYIISGGEVYFNEMNTVPGSLAHYLFSEKFSDFKEILTDIIEQGLKDFHAQKAQTVKLDLGVINKLPTLHGKRL